MPDNSKITLWDNYYRSLNEAFLFPNEFVVRAFLGKYPNHNMDRNYKGKKVCDISCGDGRNLTLLNRLGFELYATEVSLDICEITRNKLARHADKISVDIRPGLNFDLPFDDAAFDYLLSWNALYYMRAKDADIGEHINEFARVLKPGGQLVACVPSPGCFSLAGAKELGGNLIEINNSSASWDILNGSIYYRFDSTAAIEEIFGSKFDDFRFSTLKDDCFGVALEYFIFVCTRK